MISPCESSLGTERSTLLDERPVHACECFLRPHSEEWMTDQYQWKSSLDDQATSKVNDQFLLIESLLLRARHLAKASFLFIYSPVRRIAFWIPVTRHRFQKWRWIWFLFGATMLCTKPDRAQSHSYTLSSHRLWRSNMNLMSAMQLYTCSQYSTVDVWERPNRD